MQSVLDYEIACCNDQKKGQRLQPHHFLLSLCGNYLFYLITHASLHLSLSRVGRRQPDKPPYREQITVRQDRACDGSLECV